MSVSRVRIRCHQSCSCEKQGRRGLQGQGGENELTWTEIEEGYKRVREQDTLSCCLKLPRMGSYFLQRLKEESGKLDKK